MTDFTDNAHALTADVLAPTLVTLTEHNHPVFVWGAPGIGKSDVIRSVAAERGIDLIDIRLSQFDPVDLRGIPTIDGDFTKWLPPGTLPTSGSGILFLDEMNSAPMLVQAAAYQLVLDRKLGEYTLPDGWSVVAAGNRETDRAVANRMPSALANRFTHFELTVDVDAWSAWALGRDLPVEVVAYMRYRPEALFEFDPKSNEKRFPSPRAWERVAEIVGYGLPSTAEYATIAGTVGDGRAAEFCAFLTTFRKLPNPDRVLMDPANAPVPSDDPAALHALASILARRADGENFDKVWTYAQRMPQEFTVVTMVEAIRRDESLQETRSFIEFSTTHADLVL